MTSARMSAPGDAPPVAVPVRSPGPRRAPDGRRDARIAALAAAEARRRRLQRLLPWLVGAAALLIWEAACAAFAIPLFILPPPSAVAASIVKWWSPLLANAAQTLTTTLAGFAVAIVVGLGMGVLIGSSRLLYHGLYPLIIGFESVPKVAVVPLLVIWFGIGTIPAIITSFLMAFFPIMVNVSAGIATMEPELRDVLRSLGARPRDIILKVGLPRSMPYFFASLKVAITVSFVGSIISETIGANTGIGHLIMLASSRFDVALVFAGLLATATMGIAMYGVAGAVERRMTRWATP
jgi:NitT/TauT family transport system permease protein